MASKSVILFAALFATTSVGVLSTQIFKLDVFFEPSSKAMSPFVARVKLETNCEITNGAFAVRNLRTNEVIPFRHGEVFVRAALGDELLLSVSDEFPHFELNAESIRASKNVVMSHDCNSPPRLESIFSSMNEQFGVNGSKGESPQ